MQEMLPNEGNRFVLVESVQDGEASNGSQLGNHNTEEQILDDNEERTDANLQVDERERK
jgi:hypothetical protein